MSAKDAIATIRERIDEQQERHEIRDSSPDSPT